MSRQINLLLGIHNHQPVDNWEHIMREAARKCYRPFLDILEAHPSIHCAIHNTGYLLDWLAEHERDWVEQLSRLAARGQVELMTGGYYEPILAVIPEADKVGQIRKLTARIRELTGQSAQGLWLAERVWEPHLVKPLADAGVKYLFLDDSHFKAVGLEDADLFGRYVTEEEGRQVEIFPINKELRYKIPYAPPEQVVDYLLSQATEDGERVAVYFDDGEKFGVWPGSFKSVYQEKWLDRFFTLLEEHQDVIKTVTPNQYRQHSKPAGRIYLPTASYSEMMTWSMLPRHIQDFEQAVETVPREYHRFLHGGYWRNFLVKYPEANQIHKKMLYVSDKIQQMRKRGVEEKRVRQAEDELWQGQSNDIFWHGVFGGLYLTNLRSANYRHLIQAETLADTALKGATFFEASTCDLDCDGQPEVLIESHLQNLYFDPDEGGALFELDFRPKAFNLLDTLARGHEAYHEKLRGNGGSEAEQAIRAYQKLSKALHYDWHRRVSLLDHFWGEATTLESLYQASYPEQGDFVNQPYQVELHQNTLRLWRHGTVWNNDTPCTIEVEKVITVKQDAAEARIDYTLTNHSPHPARLWFAPEFNVNLLAPDAPDRYYYLPSVSPALRLHDQAAGIAVAEPTLEITDKTLASRGVLQNIHGIGLRDEWLGIDYVLSWDKPADLWRFPVETVSQAEYGFDTVYQSSALYPNWRFELTPGQAWQITLKQEITGF